MPYHDFTEMPIWIKAMNIAVQVFELSSNLPRTEDYGLTSQIRRSAESISANIAEGFGKSSINDKVKYYEIPMTKLRDLPFFKNRLKKTLN